MHGSVCLLSRYLKNLLEGENLDELDISSASGSNNIYRNKKSLSTGWKGTCPILELMFKIQSDVYKEIYSFDTIITSDHQKTINSYETSISVLESLYVVNYITEPRPSGLTEKLLPSFEYEFSDRLDTSLIGGEIYQDFTSKLSSIIYELNENILNEINSIRGDSSIKEIIDTAFLNFKYFDTAVATASNVMNNRIIEVKNYFLTIQFLLMFFTWGYLLFFIALVVVYIIYLVKEYEILHYIIIILVNILFVMILIEIFLSAFFGQFRLICHEVPRALNFIFTGTYMVSGNSASYPAQFGRGDKNMTLMFTTCLNKEEDLTSLFIPIDYFNNLIDLQNHINTLHLKLNTIIEDSNIITHDYESIDSSNILKAINQLEFIHENLNIASEGFGQDKIYNILRNIRENLDNENCSMTQEYYVVKESDCPSGSVIVNEIIYIPGIIHCYIIQNLNSGTKASYTAYGCDNDYINKAITFIQNINLLLEARLMLLKNYQDVYSTAFRNLSNEINSLSQTVNDYNSYITNDLNLAHNISNCGSARFDLIDFSDFISDTTEYDARIVVIFSAFLGVFGFVLLYSFLVVMNGFNTNNNNNYNNGFDYGFDFRNYQNRNINIKVNKSRPKLINQNFYDTDDNDYRVEGDDEDNNKKIIKNPKFQAQPRTEQKVEMSYISKNNEDSDSD